MALARTDLLVEFKADTSGTLDVTSTAFTPPNNSLLVFVSGGLMNADPGTATTITTTGLTWTNVNRAKLADGAGYFAYLDQWIVQIGTAALMTVRIQNAASITDSENNIQCFAYTGYDTSTPTSGTTTTTTLGSSGAGTIGNLSVAPASGDVTVASRRLEPTAATDSGASPAAGWTEIYDNSGSGTGYGNVETEQRTGSTSAAVAWTEINVGAVGVRTSIAAAFNIKAAAAGGAANRIFFPSQHSAMGVGGMLGGNRVN